MFIILASFGGDGPNLARAHHWGEDCQSEHRPGQIARRQL